MRVYCSRVSVTLAGLSCSIRLHSAPFGSIRLVIPCRRQYVLSPLVRHALLVSLSVGSRGWYSLTDSLPSSRCSVLLCTPSGSAPLLRHPPHTCFLSVGRFGRHAVHILCPCVVSRHSVPSCASVSYCPSNNRLHSVQTLSRYALRAGSVLQTLYVRLSCPSSGGTLFLRSVAVLSLFYRYVRLFRVVPPTTVSMQSAPFQRASRAIASF